MSGFPGRGSRGEGGGRTVFGAKQLPEELAQPLALARDRLAMFYGRIWWYDEVRSTNDVAAAFAEAGAEEGTVVAADAQSAGRGRLGRVWVSPPGAGLYVSVILRPPLPLPGSITIAAGVALSDAVHAATGLDTTVKWPNDIYVGPRKLAGILAEAGTAPGGAPHVVLGFGVNIMQAAYPPDVDARATSLVSELGRPVERGLVLAECLAALASRYRDLCQGRTNGVIAAWRRRAAATFGRVVEWEAAGVVRRGIAEDVDDAGALLIRTDTGIVRLISGEIGWL